MAFRCRAAAAVAWGLFGRGEPPSAPPRAPGSLPACAAWPAARVVEDRVALGPRGEASADAPLALGAADGCTTELVLGEGTVDVHARDLGGGTLRVRAGEVTVEVRGTRFEVRRSSTDVEVRVAHGHVVVRAPEERELHLRTGERWIRGGPLAAADAPTSARAEGAEGAEGSGEPAPRALDAPEPALSDGRPRASKRAARDAPHADEDEDPHARLARAEARWRSGERAEARALFESVGAGSGALAEAAWIRLARLTLRGGDAAGAREATRAHQRRFPDGRLAAEALWIEAEAARALGEPRAAEAALARLRARFPGSPQARAAAEAP
ncbi:MAG: FecR domain-containing protein [Sandaracinaceae bacterium]|nr:FecR domain-containing protein [Sandaracinaceae bacterium]